MNNNVNVFMNCNLGLQYLMINDVI
jgi:hypothetical protein